MLYLCLGFLLEAMTLKYKNKVPKFKISIGVATVLLG